MANDRSTRSVELVPHHPLLFGAACFPRARHNGGALQARPSPKTGQDQSEAWVRPSGLLAVQISRTAFSDRCATNNGPVGDEPSATSQLRMYPTER